MKWTKEQVAFLVEFYPIKGKMWCAAALGLREGQVRMKASRLGLDARHTSEAVKERCAAHAEKLRGRKRPDQSAVMKGLHESGKLLKTPAQRLAQGVRTSKWIAEHGHPRGALGMKHSQETKKAIGKKSSAMWTNMSEDERDRRSRIASENCRRVAAKNRSGASWKAAWREIGGKRKFFRSRWEANYARFLEWLKGRGEISEWEHEAETFWFDGIKRGTMSYLPDFRVTNKNGSIEYHEVKGWMDARSRTTIRRMAKYHPSVKLVVIDGPRYKAIANKMKYLIAGWE